MLHIAVELGEARMGFVEKLVEFMPSEALALRDSDGATALFNAARAGNIKAVKLLVNKNPSLPNICQPAITIPGGNHDDTGIPNFSKEKAFKVFAASDALSLFLSIASVLICLSILTARYAEDDFLFALPRRLIFGLVTLFLSVTFMMIAYSSAIYLLFGEKKAWILTTLAALACLPVTLYGILQFPLLVELIYSTYGPGIFGKHSNSLIR
uniref:PGG domain-containing protein n=1 Tax=Vitis vinifera TaxID=29760 RepID=F6I4Y6_VITVI